ncbi:hypothetical protein JL722_946 [Aureococcus anophagefferens]|nr:hypothetical protein JL722_946 [Aureococcus anophagefferens]
MSGPPRMIVEIVFADDRTEHIEVRDGDDPGHLAREFLGRFGLPDTYEDVLKTQIEASIAEDERQRKLHADVAKAAVSSPMGRRASMRAEESAVEAQAPATAFEKAIRSRTPRDDDGGAAPPPPEPAAEEEEEEETTTTTTRPTRRRATRARGGASPPTRAARRTSSARGRAGASIHERLHDEHDELVAARACRSSAESASERDWLCPKCGHANGPAALACQRVVGFRVNLQDACPSSWAWADETSGNRFGGPRNVVRCDMARPDVGKPTICAPKSRRLIDAWRRGSTKTQSRSFSPRNAPENVWDDLYHHAFEPALCRLAPSDRKDDAELTFEPKIDEHSKAIVREKAVVDAILQVLTATTPRRGGASTTAAAAAEAAYAAAISSAPLPVKAGDEIHERLYRESFLKAAKIERCDDATGQYPFKPDIGTARYRAATATSQRALDARLMTSQLAKNRPRDDASPRDAKTGQRLYEPLVASRGPLGTPHHRQADALPERGSIHGSLHRDETSVARRRDDLGRSALLTAKEDASRSHVSDRSRLMLESMRYAAYADIFRVRAGSRDRGRRRRRDAGSDELAADVAATPDYGAALEKTLDPRVRAVARCCGAELAAAAAKVLEDAAGAALDFEAFCFAMEAAVPRAGRRAASSRGPRDAAAVSRRLAAAASGDDDELTFAPALSKRAGAKLDPARKRVDPAKVEEHLLTYAPNAKQRGPRKAPRRGGRALHLHAQGDEEGRRLLGDYPLVRKYGGAPSSAAPDAADA